MAFNFGTTPAFGTTPSSTASNFGFANTSTTNAKPTPGFGTSSFPFGTSTTPSTGGFGLGTATTPSTGFGTFGSTFGAPATQTTTFGFGNTALTTTTASTGFGGFGTSTFGSSTTTSSLLSGFGQPQNTQATGFGTSLSFGTTTTPAVGLGSTGLGSGLTQAVPQQQVQSASELEQVIASVLQCCMFGDERDDVLAKWNLLQASWGTGKGYYNPNLPPVDYTQQNPFYRFKAIVYSVKPTVETRDGFVALQFNKKEEEVRKQHEQVGQGLANIFGLAQRLNLTLHLDTIKPISENTTLVFIFMEDKSSNGQVKRIQNTELASFLLQPNQVNQLKQMGVMDCYPFTSPDKDQIQEYLDTPPPGIEESLWKQAQADNSDPERLIPMPLLGFGELRWRYHCQVEETKRHTAFLDTISEEILRVRAENETARLKINEYKQKVVELEHRLLEVMVKSVISRNIGVALRPEEEHLRSQLDTIQAQLNSPQFSGRLVELLTQVRLHKQEVSQRDSESYNMTPPMKDEIKQFLFMQQDAIKSVLDIMQNDEADLKILANDMEQLKAKIHSRK